ncbi:Low-affinity inorganic phosphate transporter 1 (plasmid) [Methylobacterium bullatum]|uniref:Low-affinity inorganic phosphate transporter 1 n=1 Tax=Methylobacterium bullatum TaxID=570505 RepID=A0A679JSM3_9HYPH|nr:Low-affinity inorganic phosphate transporter 1 [Methylobacterium bullatum]
MARWKRIGVTVVARIGKTHLTYAQGASAEMVAAGTMAANGLGLQMSTVRNMALAVALTLPSAITLAGVSSSSCDTFSEMMDATRARSPVRATASQAISIVTKRIRDNDDFGKPRPPTHTPTQTMSVIYNNQLSKGLHWPFASFA